MSAEGFEFFSCLGVSRGYVLVFVGGYMASLLRLYGEVFERYMGFVEDMLGSLCRICVVVC